VLRFVQQISEISHIRRLQQKSRNRDTRDYGLTA